MPVFTKGKIQGCAFRALGWVEIRNWALLLVCRGGKGAWRGVADEGIALERVDRAAVGCESRIIIGDDGIGNANGTSGEGLQAAADAMGDQIINQVYLTTGAADEDSVGAHNGYIGTNQFQVGIGPNFDAILPAIHDRGIVDHSDGRSS